MNNLYTPQNPGTTWARTGKAPTSSARPWLWALLAVLLTPWVGSTAFGQVSAYTFAASSGTYTPISGGTAMNTPASAPYDDEVFITGTASSSTGTSGTGFPIGFNFTFGPNTYTRFAINANGYIYLGNGTFTAGSGTSLTSNSNCIGGYSRDNIVSARFQGTTTTGSPTLTAVNNTANVIVGSTLFGTGIPTGTTVLSKTANTITMSANATSNNTATTINSTGNIKYELTGTSPNQVLTVEFSGIRRYAATYSATGDGSDGWNFQIKLFETTNVVQMVYGGWNAGTTSTTGAIGLNGAAIYRTLSSTTGFASPTVGTSSSSTVTTSATLTPASGLTYTFTPPVCSGTPTAGTIAPTSIIACGVGSAGGTLTVTGMSAGATGLSYSWESAPDASGVPAGPTTISGATSTTYAVPNYGGSIIYYRMRTTCAASGLSAATAWVRFGPSTPTTQASNIVASAVSINTATLSWTNGNGNFRIVKINTSNSFTDPNNGDDPSASNVYGGGEQVIYKGTAATVNVSGLTGGTTYYVRVYEGTCQGTSSTFLVTTGTNNPLAAGFTTVAPVAYTISRTTSATYTSIVGTSGAVASGTTGDDVATSTYTMPFVFKLQNQTISGFTASTNGAMSLRTSGTGGSSTFTNNLGSTGLTYAILAPYWDDLYAQSGVSNISYKVLGTAPNRTLVMEWKDMKTYSSTLAAVNPAPSFNFQVILHEGDVTSDPLLANVIEYNYGQMQAYSFSPVVDRAFSYTVGIKGFAVSSPALSGEIIAQQYENSAAFGHRGAGTSNAGANALRQPIACYSNITFKPAASTSSYSNPSLSPPSNDEPSGAITLTPENGIPANLCGSGGTSYNYSSRKATPTTTTTAPGITTSFTGTLAGALPDDDVWFKFTPNNPSTTIRVVGSGGYYPAFELYTYDGSTFTLVGTNTVAKAPTSPNTLTNGGVATLNSNAGGVPALIPFQEYYVRVFHFGGGNQATGTATTDASGTITSVALTSGGTGYIQNSDGGVFPRIEVTGTGLGGFVSVTASGTAAAPGPITTISLVNGGAGYPASTTFPLTFDSPAWGLSGDFAIVVNSTPAVPTNDECNTAKALSVPTTLTPITNEYTQFTTASSDASACSGGLPAGVQDVWYAFQATFPGATVNVSPVAGSGFDPKVEVFTLGAAANITAARSLCGSKTALTCQDLSGSNSPEVLTLTGLTPGQWYAVRVYNASGGVGGTSLFNIGVYASDIYPPTVTVNSYTPGTCPNPVAHVVSATIADAATVTAARIIYSVNGGPLDSVAMSLTSGTNLNGTWQGTIPAKAAQAQVSFSIRAVDGATVPNQILVDGGSYQDAYLSINAGPDKGANLGGTTQLSATGLEQGGTVRITEVILYGTGTGAQSTFPTWLTSTDDNVEISNLSTTTPADISNFTIYYLNSTSASTSSFTFPSGTILPARSVAVVHIGTGTDNPSNFFFNTGSGTGPTSGDNVGYYMRNSSGQIIDAVAVNSYTWSAALGIGAQWSGAGVSSPSGIAGAQLRGADGNSNANWTTASASVLTTQGALNAGLPTVNPAGVTWTGGNITGSLSGATITTPVFSTLTTYTFTVSISDGVCTATDNVDVTVQPPVTPVADFIATPTTGTIGGTITNFQLTDQSTNVPDTWAWSFSGPGTVTYVGSTSASSQNPQVTFTSAGTYNVTLTASNPAGSNAKTRTSYITVSPSYCTPAVTNFDTDEDVGRIVIGTWNNGQSTDELNNPDAVNGYSDLTAQPGPSFQPTVAKSASVWVISENTTNYYTTSVNVYIDFNKSGTFDQGELVLSGVIPANGSVGGTAGQRRINGTINLPYTALLGTTRMRVIAWETSTTTLNPCGTAGYGEFEDYTVTIVAPPACTTPPIGGTLSSTTPTGCGTGTNGVFNGTLTGASGSTYRWEYEFPANSGTWNAIPTITGTTASIQANTTGAFRIRVAVGRVGCAEAYSNIVTYTVNDIPTAPTATSISPTSTSTCATPTTITLNGTAPSGSTVRWYTVATGGSPVATGTGVTYSSTNSVSFYGESYNATTGCASTRTSAIAFTNTAQVTNPTVTNARRCGPGTIDLTATNGTNGTQLRWYTVSTGGSPIATGSPYTTPSLTSNQTYYVDSYNPTSQCVSATRVAVVATVDNNIPGPAATVSASRCGPGTVTLNVTNQGAYYRVRWWDALTGGTQVGSLPAYTTPSLTGPTSYYAELTTTTLGSASLASLPTPNTTSTASWDMVFTVSSATTLQGVYIYPGSTGTFAMQVLNPSSTVLITTADLTITAGMVGVKTYIPLNLSLPAGSGYIMRRTSGSASLQVPNTTSQFTVPMISGPVTITSVASGFNYLHFYDWQIGVNGCSSPFRTPALANVKPLGTWQGTTSDWNTGGNWCGSAVPTVASDVLIETGAGIIPPVLTGSGTAKSLTLGLNAGLTLNGALSVTGNIGATGANTGIDGTGTLTLNGSTAQSISGTISLPNTVVANSTNIPVGATVSINPGRVLTINAALSVATGGNLVLRSTPAGTASIAPVSNPANFSNQSITMERHFINSGWHFTGAPIKNVNFTQWSESGQRNNPLNNSTLFRYTEPDVTAGVYNRDTTERNGWKIVKNFTDIINPGDNVKGYRAWIRPSFMTQSSHAGYHDVTGVPYVGPASSTYSFTAGTWQGGGYNLLSNPYPSAISWSSVVASNGGNTASHGGKIYIWNATTNSYGQYVAGAPTGTNGVADVIPSSQGFFIWATSAAGASSTLNYVETHKVSGSGSFLRTSTDPYLKVRLNKAGSTSQDEALVWIKDGMTIGYDQGYDGDKMRNPGINVSFMPMNGLDLGISAQPMPERRQVIPMGFKGTGEAEYTMTFENAESLTDTRLYLHDKFLNVFHDIATGPYVASVTSNPLSDGDARFELVMEPTSVTAVRTTALAQLTAFPNPTTGEAVKVGVSGLKGSKAVLSLIDNLGREVYTTSMTLDNGQAAQNVSVSTLPAGLYTISVMSEGNTLRQQLVVK